MKTTLSGRRIQNVIRQSNTNRSKYLFIKYGESFAKENKAPLPQINQLNMMLL